VAGDRPTYTYRFLKEAEADFLERLRFYAERDRAVARRFDRVIKHAVAIIVDNPDRWPSRTALIDTSSAIAFRTP
jgi:plasmid stabilization system protein ParE